MNVKKAILDGLRELLNVKKLDEITVQDILDASDVSRRTFYRYYRDKYDVITRYYLENVVAQQTDLTPDSIYQVAKEIILFAIENRQFFKHAIGHGDINSLDHMIYTCSFQFCEILLNKGTELQLSDEEQFKIEFFSHGCVGIFRRCILEKELSDVGLLSQWIVDLLPQKLIN